MYSLSYFKENDKDRILAFIREYPFAFLTGTAPSGEPAATQIPMLVKERDGALYLQGHIMKNTDHHNAFSENPDVLAVFTGPHSYVSASWYAIPGIASTWNYMSVHVRGKMKFMSEAELVKFMRKFTLWFEESNLNSPTIYDNLPNEFLDRMMPAITGFEIRADQVENVFKLSQNRDEESYHNIIAQLAKKGGNGILIAEEMQKRIPELFPTEG